MLVVELKKNYLPTSVIPGVSPGCKTSGKCFSSGCSAGQTACFHPMIFLAFLFVILVVLVGVEVVVLAVALLCLTFLCVFRRSLRRMSVANSLDSHDRYMIVVEIVTAVAVVAVVAVDAG